MFFNKTVFIFHVNFKVTENLKKRFKRETKTPDEKKCSLNIVMT